MYKRRVQRAPILLVTCACFVLAALLEVILPPTGIDAFLIHPPLLILRFRHLLEVADPFVENGLVSVLLSARHVSGGSEFLLDFLE